MHDVLINGMALNDGGLTDTNAINGYGLNTFGFIWGCGDFWYGPWYSNGTLAPQSWSLCPQAAGTSWVPYTAQSPTLTTSWTLLTANPSCNQY